MKRIKYYGNLNKFPEWLDTLILGLATLLLSFSIEGFDLEMLLVAMGLLLLTMLLAVVKRWEDLSLQQIKKMLSEAWSTPKRCGAFLAGVLFGPFSSYNDFFTQNLVCIPPAKLCDAYIPGSYIVVYFALYILTTMIGLAAYKYAFRSDQKINKLIFFLDSLFFAWISILLMYWMEINYGWFPELRFLENIL